MYAWAGAFSLLVSVATACLMFWHVGTDEVGYFVVSLGMLAFAAASDAHPWPPIYQLMPLCIVLNLVWYVLLIFSVKVVCSVIGSWYGAVKSRKGAA